MGNLIDKKIKTGMETVQLIGPERSANKSADSEIVSRIGAVQSVRRTAEREHQSKPQSNRGTNCVGEGSVPIKKAHLLWDRRH